MKTSLAVLLLTIFALAFALTWVAAAPPSRLPAAGAEPRTVRVNLPGMEPVNLDPAGASDPPSFSVLEQLFLGLVDIDDASGEVQPELATDWLVSPDGRVYTFTLRSDASWTDGQPVTAHDASYALIRSLDPGNDWYGPTVLYDIVNAEAYHTGAISDPGQVGVTALDDTHLLITLQRPASHLLPILANCLARPVPKHAVEAWGDGWTDPAHFVTNGPYRLTEWLPGDHLTLDKNPGYYGTTRVQIERIIAYQQPELSAWSMYLDGSLDTALLPAGVSVDPILRSEVHRQPRPRATFLGFSTAHAPFDNLLVRKAFAAATNREGLIHDVHDGLGQSALTLTPPGIPGHVDGVVEGLGIQYNPMQARQWLSAAGYHNVQDFPATALWADTSNLALAEYLRDNWASNLGVTVTVQVLPWSEYLQILGTGQCPIWRGGWQADYNDARNFLHDAVMWQQAGPFGTWSNSSYNHLLDLAAAEQDADARQTLYRQVEEILVETDAIIVPLYSGIQEVAAKPYLRRTYPAFGAPDVATWRMVSWQVLLPIVIKQSD
jgi:oligopeptide transport system substrate-binding protein